MVDPREEEEEEREQEAAATELKNTSRLRCRLPQMHHLVSSGRVKLLNIRS